MNNTITNEENICELKRSDFQREINGKQTDLFILKNDNGAEVAFTNYGGALLAIMMPDKNGKDHRINGLLPIILMWKFRLHPLYIPALQKKYQHGTVPQGCTPQSV